MLKVYLGYDPREHEAWEVAAFSLRRRASCPVLVTPLYSMNPLYDRPSKLGPDGNRIDGIDGTPFGTEFSFARFLVPACEKYTGWALFADADFLFLDDVDGLRAYMDTSKAVLVVKHNHVPVETEKADGRVQSRYHRKNWSSFVLWNCQHPSNRTLTPEVVNSSTGAFLHQFQWLKDEEIGALPGRWNHLVDYDPPIAAEDASALHYTKGGPWFEKYVGCGFAEHWRRELGDMRSVNGFYSYQRPRANAVSR
mgnify:CR=1 FL=1